MLYLERKTGESIFEMNDNNEGKMWDIRKIILKKILKMNPVV